MRDQKADFTPDETVETCSHPRRCELEAANDLHNGIDWCPDCFSQWINGEYTPRYITLTVKVE